MRSLISSTVLFSICASTFAAVTPHSQCYAQHELPRSEGHQDTTSPALSSISHIFSNPPRSSDGVAPRNIPTSYESAVMGRRILALTPYGTLSSIFPPHNHSSVSSSSSSSPSSSSSSSSSPSPCDEKNQLNSHYVSSGSLAAQEERPDDVAGNPIGLMDYIANCEDDHEDKREGGGRGLGNPTILAIHIATSFKNAREGNGNVSLSMRWEPPYEPDERIEGGDLQAGTEAKQKGSKDGCDGWRGWWQAIFSTKYLSTSCSSSASTTTAKQSAAASTITPVTKPGMQARTRYSAANLPRFSLQGFLEPIFPEGTTPDEVRNSHVGRCFVRTHPDSKYWFPGNKVHKAEFMRLVVTHVYWVGGFGDRAYIGWIPVKEWNQVSRKEWEAVRLPGEKKGWKEWSVGEEQEQEETKVTGEELR